ncbi:MAG: NfeD family protein [Chloroflexota bacterium]
MVLDPNLIYLILVAGLWLSVIAIHMPGTGAVEILAAIGMIGALVGLANLPTNWWALIVLVVGVLGFLVMPFLGRRFVALAVGGLILQAAGSLTLFNGVAVAPPLIAVTIGVSLIYYRFALLRILDYREAAPAMLDDEPLVGVEGYVQKALDPVGTVYVRGESWTARSDEPLAAGTEVAVVDQEGLTLFVEAVKHKRHQTEGE